MIRTQYIINDYVLMSYKKLICFHKYQLLINLILFYQECIKKIELYN